MAGRIPYTVHRKRIKNLYVRVKPPDGRVEVSAPLFLDDLAIEKFVAARSQWIARKQREVRERSRHNVFEGAVGQTVALWGRPLSVRRIKDKRYAIQANGDVLTVQTPASGDEARIREHLMKWYASCLKEEVRKRLPLWESRCGLHCDEWRVKRMKTRWGTCNIKKRRIWLNTALAQYPKDCLDYVIVHELTHLIERGHGPRFQALMDGFLPSWRTARQRLEKPPA